MTDTERLRRLDRENEELRDMLNQVAWYLGLDDEVHYYSGDNYAACQSRVLDAIDGLTKRESDVETVRSDAMEAWEWVREHGGLDEVKKLARYETKEGIELVALGKLRCLAGVRQGEAASIADMAESIARRLMPEGMEWLRYEDGESVEFGCEFANAKGNASTLRTVVIKDCRDALGGAVFWKLGKGECAVTLKNGECVRRPAKPEPPDSWERIEEDAKKDTANTSVTQESRATGALRSTRRTTACLSRVLKSCAAAARWRSGSATSCAGAKSMAERGE